MSEFRTVEGFEDVWRPAIRPRKRSPKAVLGRSSTGPEALRARLVRLVQRAPEVMVKITGRTHDAAHLRAHLEYISRNGALEVETQDGGRVDGQREIAELAGDWAVEAMAAPGKRKTTPFSHALMLSMPEGSDPMIVRDAARAFAVEIFGGRHDYVFALHTDTPRPHVHLTVSSLGRAGQRLNPKKADLEAWRQVFAEALRSRGHQAEATPRRARGVPRKGERTALRKISDRHQAGAGPPARNHRAAHYQAAQAALGRGTMAIWERQLIERQTKVRALYLAQAALLATSDGSEDRGLAEALMAFVRAMPVPDSRRLALARQMRADRGVSLTPPPSPERNRER